MARSHVPKFGNWENGDDVPYTTYFEKARQGRSTGKMTNPNDPQETPELFAKKPPPKGQTQPRPPPPKHITEPGEPIVRGPVRPGHERRTSRENYEFRQSPESLAQNENVGRKATHASGRGPNSGRPAGKSGGSQHSFELSPLHPYYQAKVAGRGGGSPSWDEKSSYDSSHGTPERPRMRPANRGRETPDRGAAVPKFGEWDENNPSSAEGYTRIFNKVREERHTGAKSPVRVDVPSYPAKQKFNDDNDHMKSCCFPWGRK